MKFLQRSRWKIDIKNDKKFGNTNFDEHFCDYTSIYTFYEIIVIAIHILQQANAINKLIRGWRLVKSVHFKNDFVTLKR